MSKLSQVLSDPQSVNQLSQLAAALGSGAAANRTEAENNPPQNPPQGAPPDISSLLASLFPREPPQNPPPNSTADSGTANIAGIMQAAKLLTSPDCAADKNVALLTALRPLLREENQVKIDRLIKIFRLLAAYPLLRDSGLLQEIL